MLKSLLYHLYDVIQGVITVIGGDPYHYISLAEMFDLAPGIVPHCS